MKYKIKSVDKIEIINCPSKTYHLYKNGKRICAKTTGKKAKGADPK